MLQAPRYQGGIFTCNIIVRKKKYYLNLIMMQGNWFFSYALFTGGIWGSLPWEWHLEGPLAPGRQYDVVHESAEKMQPKFIVWLWDFTNGSLRVHNLSFSMMHFYCMVSFACSAHVSRWILADFLEEAIDNWPQWLSDTAKVWLMSESSLEVSCSWDRLFSTARFLCELFIWLLNKITPPIFPTSTFQWTF